MRTTLRNDIEFSGVGLHSGHPVSLILSPLEFGAGIHFLRTDLPADTAMIPARFDQVTDTRLCTRVENADGASVSTVEHLMAALAGCGVTDALIGVDGPEIPIMDGSSAGFVRAIGEAGLVRGDAPLKAIKIIKPVTVEDGDKSATLRPDDGFSLEFHIAFDDPAIGRQSYEMALINGAFVSELSDCRTFGFLHEVEYLRSKGLAKGGGLQNAIVIDKGRVLNPEGLRRDDEFVRHKMLDAVGDLALAGAPIIGRYVGVKAGHEMTNRLLRALFEQDDAWIWVDADPALLADPFTAGHPLTGRDDHAIAV